jgi:hypothetical protein
MSRWTIALALLLACIPGASQPAAADRLRVTVGPHLSFEPAEVRVVAYVRPDPNNRRLHIEADSGDHFTSSDWPIDGDQQPVATTVWLKNLPAGEYRLRVTLEHGRGASVVAVGAFEVMGARERER